MLETGVITAFDATAWTADLWLAGSAGGVIAGAPVGRGLPAAVLATGPRCLVWAPPGDPAGWLVVAIF